MEMPEEFRKYISERTRMGLAAARARGVRLGSPKPMTENIRALGRAAALESRRIAHKRWLEDIGPSVQHAFETAGTISGAAKLLNNTGVSARRGGQWTATGVRRILMSGNLCP